MADDLDAEAFRNSAGRELFTNPAKTLAERMSGRDVVLAGDNAGTLRAVARHGAAINAADRTPEARREVGLADVLVVLHDGMGGCRAPTRYSLAREIDGPAAAAARTFVLATDAERPVVLTRVSGFDDVDVVNAEDVLVPWRTHR